MVIHIYNQNHTLDYSVEFDVEKRSVQSKDIEFNLRNINEEFRHYFLEDMPAYKPAFLDAWVSATLILLHTDNKEQGKEFVVLSLEGTPLGKFYLSIYDEIQYISEEQVYTLHKDPDEGHTIRKYRLIL